MARRRRRKSANQAVNHFVWFSVLAIFFLVLSTLVLDSFFRQGDFLIWLNNFFDLNFGYGALVVPFVFLQISLVLFRSTWIWSQPTMLLGGVFFFIGLSCLTGGGQVGGATFNLFADLITPAGSILFFTALIISGLLILAQISLRDILNWYKNWRINKKVAAEMAAVAAQENGEVAFIGHEKEALFGPAAINPPKKSILQIPNLFASQATAQQQVPAVADEEKNNLDEESINSLEKIDLLG